MKDITLTAKIILIAILFTIVFYGIVSWLDWADQRADYLSQIDECVRQEMQVQGYAGNEYSQEAWELFSGNCK